MYSEGSMPEDGEVSMARAWWRLRAVCLAAYRAVRSCSVLECYSSGPVDGARERAVRAEPEGVMARVGGEGVDDPVTASKRG